MSEQANANKALVLRFMNAAQSADWGTMSDCIVEDYAQVFPRPGVPGMPAGTNSRAEIMRFVDGLSAYQSGSKRTEIECCIAEDDMVALQVRMQAVTARGEAYDNFYAHFYRCRDGRLVKAWEYADTEYAASKLIPDALNKPPLAPGSHPESPAAVEPDPVGEPKKATALRFMRAAQSADTATVAECVTEDFTLIFPRPGREGMPHSAEGRDTILEFLRHKLPYQPGSLKMTVESILGEGDVVAVQFRMNAVTARGEPYENFYVQFHQFRGDRIARSWEYCDTLYGGKMLLANSRQ